MCHNLQGQNTDISSYLICTLYETIHMEHTKVLFSLTRKWFAFFCIICARATAQDQTDMKATGLLCISDCTSCPIICAPPPPPSESKPPPSPPPQSYYFHSPPPPSYISWGNSAPPPPPKFMTIPATQVPPAGGTGQNNNYSHPYYYFYAADAASYHLDFSCFLMLLFSFHVMILLLIEITSI